MKRDSIPWLCLVSVLCTGCEAPTATATATPAAGEAIDYQKSALFSFAHKQLEERTHRQLVYSEETISDTINGVYACGKFGTPLPETNKSGYYAIKPGEIHIFEPTDIEAYFKICPPQH